MVCGNLFHRDSRVNLPFRMRKFVRAITFFRLEARVLLGSLKLSVR